MNLEKICVALGFSEAERALVEAAETQDTADRNLTEVLANLILAKERRKSASTIMGAF